MTPLPSPSAHPPNPKNRKTLEHYDRFILEDAPIWLPVSVYFCLCLSVCPSDSLYVSVCPSDSAMWTSLSSVCLCLCLSLSLCLCLSVSLCLSVCLSVSLFLCL